MSELPVTKAGRQMLEEWWPLAFAADPEGIERRDARTSIIAIETEAAAALTAERDRMKAALEDIAYWEGGPKPPHNRRDFDDAHFDCTVKEGCPAMVARAALAPGTPVDVE